MSTPYHLIEPCAGSAALTMHMLGARRALMPYQGHKWRVRRQLAYLVEDMVGSGPPTDIVLTDPAPWGTAMGVILDRGKRREVVEILCEYEDQDPRDVYDDLHNVQVPISDVVFTAEFLFLQRLAFSCKAVGSVGGMWKSPGFNKSSAYGTAATEKFKVIYPMIPSLIRTLLSYDDALREDVVVTSQRARAQDTIPKKLKRRTVVYIDPEYKDTTPYPDGVMTRQDVVDLALAYKDLGASVIISEGEMIMELMELGWKCQKLRVGRNDTSNFRGQHPEWVTFL